MGQKYVRSARSGFTLIELLIALAVISVLVLIGYPALMNTLRRARMETIVREAAMELRVARIEAIKRNSRTYLQVDFANDRIVLFREADNNEVLSAGDEELRGLTLPANISFWGPADGAPEGPDAVVSSPAAALPAAKYLTFTPAGAAEYVAAIRIADDRGNFIEARVEPKATARVSLRKWDGADWLAQRDGGTPWTWY